LSNETTIQQLSARDDALHTSTDVSADPNAIQPQQTSTTSRSLGWLEPLAAPAVFALILGPIYGFWLGGHYLSSAGRAFDLNANAPVLIITLGVMFCLIAGHFDLSVVSLAGLVAVLIIGLRAQDGLPFALVLVLGIAVGLCGGAINGFLVGRFGLNSFIATLPTSGIYLGIAIAYSKGASILARQGKNPTPDWFSGPNSIFNFNHKAPSIVVVLLGVASLAAGIAVIRERTADLRPFVGRIAIAGLAIVIGGAVWALRDKASWPIDILIAMTLIAWVVLRYTVFGRSAAAVGANEAAARLAGVSVQRTVVVSYMISGLCAAIAGILTAAALGSADPGVANAYLLPAYAAAFLSTVMFSQGRFHPWGAVLGGFAVVEVSQGLVIGGVDYQWTTFINGVALLFAIAISTIVGRKSLPR
jgi:ribose/xylose/arabinose/galactoside ABC-type transport system permease subunit